MTKHLLWVPALVLAACLLPEAGDAQTGGVTLYEAELDVNGHSKDVTFNKTGAVVAVEEQVAIACIPAPAREAILKAAGAAQVTLVEQVTEKNTVAYEGHWQRAGTSAELKVNASGEKVK